MKRIKGNSLGDHVFDILEDRILKGEYQTGESLTEIKLSEELGVSRTPVREALRKLERSGLVKIEVNKGAVVIGITEKDLKEIYTIRMYVEGLAARWATENITEETLEKLRSSVEMLEKGKSGKSEEYDSTFHHILYDACNSRLLQKMLTEFHNYISSVTRDPFKNPARAKDVAREHRAILHAIEKKDPDLAERLAKEHVSVAYHTAAGAVEKEVSKTTIQNPEIVI